ncbi:lactoylglutathione lyase GLO1 [Lachancea thermotolerans CBS 6340]|uniref:Lactoylglutathione lyase n=1 Tax=Lachancea thermotolerans (strain ATCC 56472 / CBS 6340 / NRRL Y-8284) TaxID=559295 RepID=C5DBW6_LACTC|nr:KLTH0A05896p [Lachancea thermotolerans CBS 6340]CAR21273.1 KLTH0A05896p [Lachancea thermotolerans CBS 6340]
MHSVARYLGRLTNVYRLPAIRKMSSEAKFYPIKIEAAQNDASLKLNHTCVRVKDPQRSVEFYKSKFGMELVGHKKFPDAKFDLYFLSFPKSNLQHNSRGEIDVFRENGMLELTHNYGTESDPTFKVNNGNEEPYRGFGHICFSVADIEKTCKDLEEKGVAFKKKLTDGRQKNIAFALDPDGYWIELVSYGRSDSGEPVKDEGYKFNHTMVRVKDAQKSLEFYQNVLGMKILDISKHENAKFTLYFLSYDGAKPRWMQESVLELTHNWGTESDPDFQYHNGNSEPQGYGHICISLEDPETLCKEIESQYGDKVQWGVKFNQGKMKNLAFIKDPDGYSIEVVPYGLCT